MHSINTLKTIIQSGAGIRLDAKSLGINQLNELAALASENQATLTLINANHILSDSLERLAGIGGGCIVFEF